MKYFASLFLLILTIATNAQTEPSFVVHEWGTFTSHFSGFGVPYTDLYNTLNEPVPSFVHKIVFTGSQTHTDWDQRGGFYTFTGIPTLLDATQKMETPVLYFYSATAINNLVVDVKFPQGSISEFYPLPEKREDANAIAARTTVHGNSLSLSFKHYNGFATWNINVRAASDNAQPTEPDASVSNVWLAPRHTQSNIIEASGEREKYIFYRGLGGFTNPLVPRYTKSGNILLANNANDAIPYLIVYEMTPEGKRYIWGEGSMEKQSSRSFAKCRIEVGDQKWKGFYRAHFIENLVNAGLYLDEAEAMLNTWNESYFGKPGMKIFWIVPRAFTDTILPISFSTKPSLLERVMVGRTEIEAFNSNDPYIEDPIITTDVEKVIYNIWPNPSNGYVYISSNKLVPEEITYELIDFSGRVVNSGNMKLEAGIENQLLFGNLNKGMYCLNIKGNSPKRFNLVVN